MSLEVNSVGKYFVGTSFEAAASPLEDLGVGQIGLFDASNTSLQDPATPQPFFVATRLPNNEVVKTGLIDPKNIRYANSAEQVDAVLPVYDITNICTTCDSDYSIKFDILDASAFQAYGFQPYTKLYTGHTNCCNDATTSNSCIALIKDLRDGVNADIEGLVLATATNPADNTPLDDAQLDVWDVDANGCPNLRLEVQAQAVADFCGIPYTYTFPTGVSMKVSTTGFDCCSPAVQVVTATEVVYPIGAGPDIKYQEWYHQKNATADTQYHITSDGVVMGGSLNTDAALQYIQTVVAYNDPMRSGFLSYEDPQTITIAVPTTDSTEIQLVLSQVTGLELEV